MTAVLVTRGDVVMSPVLDSLPPAWEKIVWDNGTREIRFRGPGYRAEFRGNEHTGPVPDLSVYGRYAALQEEWRAARALDPETLEEIPPDVIYVQDDDVIVSDPQAIVDAWVALGDPEALVANMPPEFRHEGYTDSCLVGFGACFHRDAPERAFSRFALSSHANGCLAWGAEGLTTALFDRTCDVVFTTLVPRRVLVNVPKTDRLFASDPNRMWRQHGHLEERTRMLKLARLVRDA